MRIFEQVITHVRQYQNTATPRPAWLQKQVDAVYLSDTDPERGLAMLIDGMQDERTALERAKYTPYHPEERHG